MASKNLTFEESMQRLEQIVTQLERGEAPLDESLALFEEGMKLANSCSKQLDEAEQAVVKLAKTADGSPEESPLEEQKK